MNTLIYFDPIRELNRWTREMTPNTGYRSAVDSNGKEDTRAGRWTPWVDVIEDENDFVIKTELPGVGKEDVSVKVENDLLTISGERKPETTGEGKRFHLRERASGKFTRSFTLPDYTDSSKVTADFRNGLLQVRLPKYQEARPRSINVKVR